MHINRGWTFIERLAVFVLAPLVIHPDGNPNPLYGSSACDKAAGGGGEMTKLVSDR